jgi:hypothetical protein
MRRLLLPACLVALSVLVFSACDDEDNGGENATPATTLAATQPPATSDAQPSPTALVGVSTVENTVEFGRDPVSGPATTSGQLTLILAEGGTPEVDPTTPAIDRMVFQLAEGAPAYQVRYVPGPVQQCASGQEVPILGSAFLEVRMGDTVAHDDQGPTVSPTDIQPALPVLQQAVQTCDFEGVVTWHLGLSQEVDFRVNIVGTILVIDLVHPGA